MGEAVGVLDSAGVVEEAIAGGDEEGGVVEEDTGSPSLL